MAVTAEELYWYEVATDQSYIGRWIVRLDGYHMMIEHRMLDKHQNASHQELLSGVKASKARLLSEAEVLIMRIKIKF